MRREDVILLPFVDERIDLGGDELLQDAAGFVVVGGEEHLISLSFRGGAKRRTRNLDIVLLISGFPDVRLHI